mgnify:CR=1 FL=1
MAAYKTPGVYAEEISTLPPSVAEVSTAVPAFFGYTEKGPAVARISTMLEYQQVFGGPSQTTFAVTTLLDGSISKVTRGGAAFLLYYAVSHYSTLLRSGFTTPEILPEPGRDARLDVYASGRCGFGREEGKKRLKLVERLLALPLDRDTGEKKKE